DNRKWIDLRSRGHSTIVFARHIDLYLRSLDEAKRVNLPRGKIDSDNRGRVGKLGHLKPAARLKVWPAKARRSAIDESAARVECSTTDSEVRKHTSLLRPCARHHRGH